MSESYCSNKPAFFLVLAFALALSPVAAHAAVEVRDVLTVSGNTIMLSARTGGGFFSEGGQLVEFLVDGESMGKTLSGGDAIAYMEYTAKGPGKYKIQVRSETDEDNGMLLVSGKGAQVLVIDVFSSLLKDPIGRLPRARAKEALIALGEKYTIIYLHNRFLGPSVVRGWIRKNELPDWPVLDNRIGAHIRRFEKMGLSVKAIVIGTEMLIAGGSGDARVFSFEKIKGTEHVSSWDDIRESLED